MGSLNIVIVGAGIAGLSVAIVLRPHAAKITILERAGDAASMNIRGAGLAQYTSAANVLRNNLGLQPLEELKMVQGQSIRTYGWQGTLTREITPPTNDWYMAHRGTLLDELFRRATEEDGKTAPAEVRFSQEVVDVDVDAGTLRTLAGDTHTADLIVGAEGVRSVVRASIVDNVVVRPSGLSIYRWTLQPGDWAHLPAATVQAIDELIGPKARLIVTADDADKRLVTYRCHQDGTVNGALILPDHKLEHTSEDWAASGSVAHLQTTCAGLGEPLRSMIGCVKACGLWQLRQQAPLPRWAKGKAIVIGDAAHPMLPFQAVAGALAMEDAEALNYALSEVGYQPSGVPQALERTFCLRFLRASLVQHFSNATSLDPKEMEHAREWSLERTGAHSVPLNRRGEDDPVQALIAQKVKEHADAFDVRATSGWVMNYTSAAAFEREQGDKFVLQQAALV